MGNLYSEQKLYLRVGRPKVEHIFGYPGGAVLPIYDELKTIQQ